MTPVRHPKGPNPNPKPNFIPNPISNPNPSNLNHICNPKPNESALYKSTFTYLLTLGSLRLREARIHTVYSTSTELYPHSRNNAI